MERILVLLSTYNGHKYLREQLDSLYAQENVHLHILVRDDGSKDETIEILNEYKNRHGKMTLITQTNIGCARSFHSLIEIAATRMPLYDYYAFCDQDDVWLPNKLYQATLHLDKIETPNKLYFCNANYVDSNLSFIKKSKLPMHVSFKTCVFRNPILGCTMVFDNQFLQLMNKGNHDRINTKGYLQLHDRWAYQCANYLGTTIIKDPSTTIQYRQHGNNVTSPNMSFLKRYKNAITKIFKYRNVNLIFNKTFYETYKNTIKDTDKNSFLKALCSYNASIKNTIIFLQRQSWEGESNLDKFLWRLLVLLRLF